jgi:hypothetical protein
VALCYRASELLLPPMETPDAGRAAAAAAGATGTARSLGGAAAATAGATGTARSIGSAAAVRTAATAAAIGAAVTARILGGKLSDRTSCRYRIGVCHGVRRRGDRRRSHTCHEQRSHEFQFCHHIFGFTTSLRTLRHLIFERTLRVSRGGYRCDLLSGNPMVGGVRAPPAPTSETPCTRPVSQPANSLRQNRNIWYQDARRAPQGR